MAATKQEFFYELVNLINRTGANYLDATEAFGMVVSASAKCAAEVQSKPIAEVRDELAEAFAKGYTNDKVKAQVVEGAPVADPKTGEWTFPDKQGQEEQKVKAAAAWPFPTKQ
jgi:hypothetical protein